MVGVKAMKIYVLKMLDSLIVIYVPGGVRWCRLAFPEC